MTSGKHVDDLRSLDLFLPESGGSGAVIALCVLFLRTHDDPWLPVSTWVRALAAIDVPDASARSALRRVTEAGHLVRETREDVPGYAMSPALTHLLQAGEVLTSTDPRWLIVTLNVPESRRTLRNQLRTLLLRGGFGSMGNGVWLGRPHNADRALDYIEVLGSAAYTQLFLSEFIGPGELRSLVDRCWDLPMIAASYSACAQLAHDVDAQQPSTGAECFAAVMRVGMARGIAVQQDPKLPRDVLPPDWPQAEALAAVDAVMARYRRRATRWLLSN